MFGIIGRQLLYFVLSSRRTALDELADLVSACRRLLEHSPVVL